MNKYKLIVLFILAYNSYVFSQSEKFLSNYYERIQIVTNSNSLLVGEELLIGLLGTSNYEGLFLSEYAYIQLISASDENVFRIAVELKNGFGDVSIFLPSSLNSGNYRLVAYTKWMLNRSIPAISGQTLSVFNPFIKLKPHKTDNNPLNVYASDTSSLMDSSNQSSLTSIEHLELQFLDQGKQSVLEKTIPIHIDSGEVSIVLPRDLEAGNYRLKFNKASIFSSTDIPQSKNPKTSDSLLMGETQESTNTFDYTTRDSVKLDIQKLFSLPKNISRAIVSVRAVDFYKQGQTDDSLSLGDYERKYIPDWRGMILSGKSNQSKSRIYVINEKQQYFNTIITDSLGKFNLPILHKVNFKNTHLLFEGENEIEFQSIDVKDLVHTPQKLSVTSEYRDEIERRSFLTQYENIYKDFTQSGLSRNHPFYGDRAESFILSDYNNFGTLQLVFREIIEGVKYRENSPNPLGVADNQARYFENPPLVMFNSTPIKDVGQLMKIKPKLIDKIDVIRKEIVFNDAFFGGVINIISSTQEYPSDFNKININIEQGRSPNVETGRLPNELDFRLQLFWSLTSNLDTLEFSISDVTGIYEIKITGVTSDQKTFTKKKRFNIGI